MLLHRFGKSNLFWKKVKRNFETSNFECFEGSLGDVLRTTRGPSKSTSQGLPLNIILGRPLDVISGRPENVRLGRTWDVRSGRLWDGQIGSLPGVLGKLEMNVLGTSRGPICDGWVAFAVNLVSSNPCAGPIPKLIYHFSCYQYTQISSH